LFRLARKESVQFYIFMALMIYSILICYNI